MKVFNRHQFSNGVRLIMIYISFPSLRRWKFLSLFVTIVYIVHSCNLHPGLPESSPTTYKTKHCSMSRGSPKSYCIEIIIVRNTIPGFSDPACVQVYRDPFHSVAISVLSYVDPRKDSLRYEYLLSVPWPHLISTSPLFLKMCSVHHRGPTYMQQTPGNLCQTMKQKCKTYFISTSFSHLSPH